MAKGPSTAFAVAYVTAPNPETARSLARRILEAKLAASANLLPAESLFWWKGRIEESRETVILFKTRRALLPRLRVAVREAHPYEVPCVVACGIIDGLPEYLAWIDASTR